jgi:hypothetical protein
MDDASKTVLDLLKQLADGQERAGEKDVSNTASESHIGSLGSSRSTPAPIVSSEVYARPSPSAVAPMMPTEDPSTITKYASALKYIVKYIAVNDFVMKEIKLMMQDQDRREQEWISRRQELQRKQDDKGRSKEELENVFRLIGVQGSHQGAAAEQDIARELQSYDSKIYQDQQRLVQEQTQQLRDLKIPLFCIPNITVPGETLKTDQRKILQLFKDLLSD